MSDIATENDSSLICRLRKGPPKYPQPTKLELEAATALELQAAEIERLRSAASSTCEPLADYQPAVQVLRSAAEYVVSELLAFIDVGHPVADNWAKKYRGHFQYRPTDFPSLGNALDVLKISLAATAVEADAQPERREQLRGQVKRTDHGDCVVVLKLDGNVAIAQDSIHGICWSCPPQTGMQYKTSKAEAIAAATDWLIDEALKRESEYAESN